MSTMNVYNDRTTSILIQEISIEGWDITNFYASCSIFESMYNHFMSGKFLLIDALSLTEKIPITGWQNVTITFKSNADGPFITWSKKFKIFQMEKTGSDSAGGTKVKMYWVHFISEEAGKEMGARISRSYVSMTEDQIVNDVATNVLGISKIECEAAKYPKSLIVPNWKPVQLIDYCSKTAVRASGYEAVNFMFFETIDGFKFKSLDSLVESSADPVHVTFGLASMFQKDNQSTTRNARIFNSKNNFDFIANSRRGVWGSRFAGVDINSKKWKNFDYVYKDDFGAMAQIDGSNEILTNNTIDIPDQFQNFGPWQSQPRNRNSDYNHKHLMKRRGHIGLWENIEYHADIDGDTRLKLGSKVTFDLPSFDGSIEETRMDSQQSGNYIVTNIMHTFGAMQHRQLVGLRKHMLKGG